MWPKRYAIWGGLIAAQPDQLAYAIVDSQTIGKFLAADVQALPGGVDSRRWRR